MIINRMPFLKEKLCRFLDCFIPCTPVITTIPGWTTAYTASSEPSFVRHLREERWAASVSPFPVRWHKTLKIYITPGEEMSSCLYLGGTYEPNQLFILDRLLKSGMTVLDIGAHMGIFSLFSSFKIGLYGKVYALEPSRREYEKLLLNIRLNRLKNIKALPQAVAAENAVANLKIGASPHTGHNTLGNFAYSETLLSHIEQIETITIDSLIDIYKIKKVDVVKIDIEGGELAALKGAEKMLATHRPVILFEMLAKALVSLGTDGEKLYEFIRSKDYLFYKYNLESGLPVRAEEQDLDAVSADFLAVPQEKQFWFSE